MNQRILSTLMFGFCLSSLAAAQQYVYPAKGQSPSQQKSDESACYTWAVQQTGVDPAKPAPQAAQPATTATGTAPGAGAGGAVRGAVVGEVVGGDAGAGAAAGAVAARGLFFARRSLIEEGGEQRRVELGQDGAEVVVHVVPRDLGRAFTALMAS